MSAPQDPSGSPWGASPPAGAPGYGAPPPAYGSPPAWAAAPSNGFGTTALVTGIVTAVLGVLPGLNFFALPVGVVALVFGFLARGKARRGEATNGGQALAGIVCGAVGLVASVLWVLAFVGLTSSVHCVSTTDGSGYSSGC